MSKKQVKKNLERMEISEFPAFSPSAFQLKTTNKEKVDSIKEKAEGLKTNEIRERQNRERELFRKTIYEPGRDRYKKEMNDLITKYDEQFRQTKKVDFNEMFNEFNVIQDRRDAIDDADAQNFKQVFVQTMVPHLQHKTRFELFFMNISWHFDSLYSFTT